MLPRLSLLTSSSPLRYISTSCPRLAGHNKWSKIKQKKGANDASKSAVFNKATLDIVNASRIGGSADPEKNASLAAVLKRLRAQDVPKENIAKALAKASKVKGSGDNLTYEAIACNNVGIIIECATDNTNRTVQTLREILTARNARIAPVGFMFQRSGLVKVSLEKGPDFDQRMEKLAETGLDNGAEDFEQLPEKEDESYVEVEFTCEPSSLSGLTTALTQHNATQLVASELAYKALESTELSEEMEEVVDELVETLEAHDDVVRVWTSAS